jgi:glycosyltransferase involved in cell wall biosynthesis
LKVAHLTTVDMSLELLVAPQLEAIAQRGGEAVGISAPGPFVESLTTRGVRHVSLPSSTRRLSLRADLRTMVEFWRVLRAERPTVLHTHNPKPGLYGRVLGRLAGVPIVVNTVHGLYATPDDSAAKRAVVYGLEAIASRFSHAELVQNPEDLALMRRWHLAPARRLHLLGNGVSLARFSAPAPGARRRIRAEWGVTEDDVVLGAVGRLVAEKGYPELFEAVRGLAGARLVVVGPVDDDKPDALGAGVLEAARAAGVVFAGFRDDMPEVYAAFDVFVLASHREGFPRAAMEAAAAGLPIVATDIRGCRQVVDDDQNGDLVPVRSAPALRTALVPLVTDPERRRRLGAASADKARAEFDESAVVARVMACYAEVAAAKGITLVPEPRG